MAFEGLCWMGDSLVQALGDDVSLLYGNGECRETSPSFKSLKEGGIIVKGAGRSLDAFVSGAGEVLSKKELHPGIDGT